MFGKINKTCKIGNIKLQNKTGVGQVLVIQNIFSYKIFFYRHQKISSHISRGKIVKQIVDKTAGARLYCPKMSNQHGKPETPQHRIHLEFFGFFWEGNAYHISTDSEPAYQLWLGRMHSPIECAFNIFLANVEDIFLQHFPFKIFPKHST